MRSSDNRTIRAGKAALMTLGAFVCLTFLTQLGAPFWAAFLLTLVVAATGLFFLGSYPEYLFPLLWISPLLILVSLQALMKEAHVFSSLAGTYILCLRGSINSEPTVVNVNRGEPTKPFMLTAR